MITIRTATPSDRDFVFETARRFSAFGPPPWRTPAEIVAGEVRCLEQFFAGDIPGPALLVAELDGRPAGFVFLEHRRDYFSGRGQAHLGMIAVTAQAEGQGAGAALLRAAEDWTRTQGYAALTLNVFEGNARARRAYERAGFRVETIHYVKTLG